MLVPHKSLMRPQRFSTQILWSLLSPDSAFAVSRHGDGARGDGWRELRPILIKEKGSEEKEVAVSIGTWKASCKWSSQSPSVVYVGSLQMARISVGGVTIRGDLILRWPVAADLDKKGGRK